MLARREPSRAPRSAWQMSSSLVAIALASVVAGCGSSDAADDREGSNGSVADSTVSPSTSAEEQQFPDIVDVVAEYDEFGGSWSFSVTVSSPYDSAARYADGWRVIGPDDTIYGVHTLTHDHVSEQPFTRVQQGVEIPADVAQVTIEGRDQANGFGGGSMIVALERQTD